MQKLTIHAPRRYFGNKMTISTTAGAMKKFRRTPWRFQETFQTPLKDLERFVAAILSANEDIKQACVVIDQIVFEPKTLKALLPADHMELLIQDCSLAAMSRPEIHKLLRAALADWIDFAFIPSPRPYVIYADHDEYTTFYANTKSNLSRVIAPLSKQGFRQVIGWQRHFDSPR